MFPSMQVAMLPPLVREPRGIRRGSRLIRAQVSRRHVDYPLV